MTIKPSKVCATTPFGRRLHEALSLFERDFEIVETHRGINLLDKIITIRTPGWIMGEDAREVLREFAAETLPAAVKVEFRFEPEGETA